ncbi:hypothetical protein [Arthrobacter sp. PM3]|uniref:hypothetical protein n=1 Tax=Arthrobacter sp. PM3 TaxID=2017685 RepID=UPI001C9B15F0|nr:hypothetical protein [Arthrobacter sp. PM3]
MCQILCVNAGIHGVGLYEHIIRIVELLFQHMQKIEPYRLAGVNRPDGFRRAPWPALREGNGAAQIGWRTPNLRRASVFAPRQ